MDKRQKRAKKQKQRQKERRKGLGQSGGAGARATEEEVDEQCGRAFAAVQAGNPEKAEKILRRALRGSPENATLLTNLIVTLEQQGRHDDALAVGRKCVEAHPDWAPGQKHYATLLKFHGRLDEALAGFRRTVELEPESGGAWRSLSGLRHFTDPGDPDIARMRAVLDRLPAGDPERAELHFALAKALEDVGAYESSFEQYERGNRIKRAEVVYRARDVAELIDLAIETQGPEFLARGPLAGTSGEAPILIVGMPRSGSTLVEQILASHPQVAGVGEVTDLRDTLRAASGDPFDALTALAGRDDAELARLGKAYVARLRKRVGDAPRIVDKTLDNLLYLGFLHLAVPGARVVHCTREPIDNCFACYKVLFTSPLDFAYDLRDLGEHYRLLMRLMEHWRAQLPGRVLDVRYEDLVADQEGGTRRLLEFCGLEWDDACLRFHETERSVSSASATQVRSPIYTTSVAKWRRYEAHLGPLISALGPHAQP